MTRKRGGPPTQRQLRVGEALRHALVGILARGHFRDPVLAAAPITVTEVRISPDLRVATVYIVPFGGGDAAPLLAALARAAGYFRSQVAREVELRYAPDLRFARDESFAAADRVEQLLHDPRVARDLADDQGDDDGA